MGSHAQCPASPANRPTTATLKNTDGISLQATSGADFVGKVVGTGVQMTVLVGAGFQAFFLNLPRPAAHQLQPISGKPKGLGLNRSTSAMAKR